MPPLLRQLITIQTGRTTPSSTAVSLQRPTNPSQLKISDRSFHHFAPLIWNIIFVPTPFNTLLKLVTNHFFFLNLNFSLNLRLTSSSNPSNLNLLNFSRLTHWQWNWHTLASYSSSQLSPSYYSQILFIFGKVSRNKPPYYCVLALWGTINLPRSHFLSSCLISFLFFSLSHVMF